MIDSVSSELLYDNINRAAVEIAQMTVDVLREEGGLHAPTTLATAGFMIGETLVRASGLHLASMVPGSLIDHGWLDNNCLRLVQMLQEWFGRHEIIIADLPTTFSQYGAALMPRDEPAKLGIGLREGMADIFAKNQIGSEERVLALALAATRLTLLARDIVHPSIGAAVVVDALVVGARMVPLTNVEMNPQIGLRFLDRTDVKVSHAVDAPV